MAVLSVECGLNNDVGINFAWNNQKIFVSSSVFRAQHNYSRSAWMSLFEWKAEYSVNSIELDSHHERLFQMLKSV